MSKKKKKNSNYYYGTDRERKPHAAVKTAPGKKTVIYIVSAAVLLLAVVIGIVACAVNSYGGIRYAKITVKDHGTIILKLDGTVAPITVKNFITLANSGFYDGLTFHRIMENFMIQGGDPDGTGGGGSDTKIKGEFSANGITNNISHERGVISMARSDPYDSASSQFFICNADSPHLDGNYAAFGYVISGIEVVDSITQYGVKYTYDGVIYDKTKQPVIEQIVEISEEEALSYTK